MSASLIIRNAAGEAVITYYGDIGLKIQAVGEVSVSRWGLAEGEVIWVCPTSLAISLSPAFGTVHPYLSYLTMEKINFQFDKDFTRIIGHFVGAFPGASSTYEYQPSFTSASIYSSPSLSSILSAAGTAGTDYILDDANAKVTFKSTAGDNLAGLTDFLLSQGLWVENCVLGSAPDCSNDGKIETPNGSPPSSAGGNWLQCPTFFQQRGAVFDTRRSWKNAGPRALPTSIYS